MSNTPGIYVSANGGEMLPPVEELASQVESAIRSELNTEWVRLMDRFGLSDEEALLMATKHVQEITKAVVENERVAIINGGYTQVRMEV